MALLGLAACSFSGSSGDARDVDGSPTADIDAASNVDAPPGMGNARFRTITVGPVPTMAEISNAMVPVRLAGDADWMANAGDNGEDLLFRLNNEMVLDHDIESIDVPSGDLIVWVRVPRLPPAGTSFEMFYGKEHTAPAKNNPWGPVADVVLHFESIAALPLDHSPNGSLGTYELNSGAFGDTPGIVGTGVSLTGSHYDFNDPAVADRDTGSFSVSLWFDQDNANTATDLGFFKEGDGNPGYLISLGTGGWRLSVSDGSSVIQPLFGQEGDLGAVDAGYVHLVGVVDRVGATATVYTNGVLADSRDLPSGFGSVSNSAVSRVGGQSNLVDGNFDELRTYPRVLSADFVAADHALVRDPGLVVPGAPSARDYPVGR